MGAKSQGKGIARGEAGMEGEMKGSVGLGQLASEVGLSSCHLFRWV